MLKVKSANWKKKKSIQGKIKSQSSGTESKGSLVSVLDLYPTIPFLNPNPN